VAYPTASWTLGDLLQAAKKLTTKDHWGLMLHLGPGASDKPSFFYFLWSFGADYINRAGTKCTLTDPRARQAFQWVLDLTYSYHVQPTAAEITANGGWSGALFTRGKVAMVLGAQRWFYHYAGLVGGAGPTFHWSAALPPLAMDGRHRYSYPGYTGLGIWPGTRNRDLAYQVAKAISQGAGQIAIATYGIDLPAYEPVLRSSAPFIAPDKQADEVSLEALKYTRMPHYVVRMQEIQAALDRDLANLWLNKDSVAHATQTACRDINPLLDRKG
jgi:ABC-type glycerol-3-phosphate transport system substrate-binding protein